MLNRMISDCLPRAAGPGLRRRIVETLVLGCLAASHASAQVLEGFENLPGVRTEKGALTAVRGADAVTEGAQAAQLPAGCGILLSLEPGACKKVGWLKIDTLTTQPLTGPILLRFTGPKCWVELYACVQAGKDTLSVPMPVWVNPDPKAWEDKLALTVSNAGTAALILDNIRFEDALKLPQDCEAIDFGPARQALWPGFVAGEVDDRHFTWSGQGQAVALRGPPIDPLCGDGVGPGGSSKAPGVVELSGAGTGPSVAWLWVTHVRQNCQAPEAALKLGSKVLWSRRPARGQMFSPEGLLEGQEGLWTPRWFEATYAPRFYDLVPVNLPPGGSKLALLNCQIAGMVVGPASAQNALAAHVEKIKKDLAQYRRQFVLGRRNEVQCEVAPTAAQAKAGMLAFLPPPDQALLASYPPQEAHGSQTLKAVAGNGMLVCIPLALSPIKRVAQISAGLEPIKSPEGKVLCPAGDAQVVFLEAVPRLVRAGVEFAPWIAAPRHGPAQPKQVVHAAVMVRVPPTAAAGTYRGSIQLKYTEGQTDLPIQIEVLQAGPPASAGLFGVVGGTGVPDFYRAWADAFTEPQQEALLTRIRQQLLAHGLNSLPAPSPILANDKVLDEPFSRAMKGIAPLGAHHLLIDSTRPLDWLLHGPLRPGTAGYQGAIREWTRIVAELLGKARSEGILYGGFMYTPEDLLDQCRLAKDFDPKSARLGLATYGSILARLPADDRERVHAFGALFVQPDVKGLGDLVTAFKAPGGKQAFVYALVADRYAMGFYAAACGADGAFLATAAMEYPQFSGFQASMGGLLVPTAEEGVAPTLAAMVLERAADDFELYRRAADLARKAEGANVEAQALAKTLEAIRAAAVAAPGHDALSMRSTSVAPAQLDAWREALVRQSAEVLSRMPPKK